MTSSSGVPARSDKLADKLKRKGVKKDRLPSHLPKQQLDGSQVISPSRDPVNSDETLRANKVGNS